jgi:hypothetical protein
MKSNSSDNTDARWQKTPVTNLVRHVQSGNYYARIRVRGKLIWKSLKTDRINTTAPALPSCSKPFWNGLGGCDWEPRCQDEGRPCQNHCDYGGGVFTWGENGHWSTKSRQNTSRAAENATVYFEKRFANP